MVGFLESTRVEWYLQSFTATVARADRWTLSLPLTVVFIERLNYALLIPLQLKPQLKLSLIHI